MDFVKSPLNWLTSTVVSATDVMHNAALYAAECVGSESSKSVTPAVNSVIFDSIGHKNTSSFLDMVRFGCHNFVSSVFRLHWAAVPFFWVGFASVVGYIGTILFQNLVLDLFPVNLKKKYGADWALVTGASSGIGKAIAQKLAGQDISVVLVALDDNILQHTFDELKKTYPSVEFRKVGVNLGKSEEYYMPQIKKATKDIMVSLVFNNAGFITTGNFPFQLFNVCCDVTSCALSGFFNKTSIERSMSNFHCNATCIVPITHHFLTRILSNSRKGLIAFTSSSAGFVPTPLSVIYPSTKSFITLFATSLAPEVKSQGVDIVVVHPSPMMTNFFHNSGTYLRYLFGLRQDESPAEMCTVGGMQTLEAFKRFAVSPSVIADVVFNSAGRFVVRDQGLVTILLRIVTKAFDFNLFTELVCRTAHTTGDFKQFMERTT
eukprot:gene4956-6924_t